MTLIQGMQAFFQALGMIFFFMVIGAAFLTLFMPTDEFNDVWNQEDEK